MLEDRRKQKVCEMIAAGRSKTRAALEVHVHRRTVDRWLLQPEVVEELQRQSDMKLKGGLPGRDEIQSWIDEITNKERLDHGIKDIYNKGEIEIQRLKRKYKVTTSEELLEAMKAEMRRKGMLPPEPHPRAIATSATSVTEREIDRVASDFGLMIGSDDDAIREMARQKYPEQYREWKRSGTRSRATARALFI